MMRTTPLSLLLLLGTALLSSTTRVAFAQEKPAFSQPLFDYSRSYRQSVCDKQALLHNGTIGLRDALEGFQLRPFVLAGRFFHLDDNGAIDSGYPGIVGELLDELAQRAGLTWRDSYAIMENIVIPENKTYDELLVWSMDTYDVSAAYWVKSVSRMNLGASFPTGWFDSSIILVGPEEEEEEKMDIFAFLLPFDWTVWLMIVITILVSGVVYWGLEMFDAESDEQSLERVPLTSIFYSAMTFTGHLEFQPSTKAARLFTFSLSLWALLTVSAYTANFASFLVAQNAPTNQVKGVADAVRLGMPLCVIRSTTPDVLLAKTYPSARLVRVKDEPSLFSGVREGKCSFAVTSVGTWEEFEGRRDVNGDCGLGWIGRVFKFQESSFVLKSDSGTLCTSLIRDVLNLHLFEMAEDGTIERAWRRHVEAHSDINCDAIEAAGDVTYGDDESQQLDLKDMGGLFIVHFALTGIAILIAVAHQWRKKRAERRKGKNSSAPAQDIPQNNGINRGDDESGGGRSASTHDLHLEQDEQGQYITTLYEEQNGKLAELSEQMRQILAAVNERQDVTSRHPTNQSLVLLHTQQEVQMSS